VDVLERVAAGRACADAIGYRRCAAELLLFSGEALARIGEREDSRRALESWDALGIREALDDILRLHVGALAEADSGARARALERALTAAEQSPFGTAAMWIRLDLGRELAPTARERAVAELERVATVASERGAATVLSLPSKPFEHSASGPGAEVRWGSDSRGASWRSCA
jgi:hypothetical protein